MDPTETLRQLRAIANRVLKRCESADASFIAMNEDMIVLAGMFSDLDQWIASGGFLPLPWQPGKPGAE